MSGIGAEATATGSATSQNAKRKLLKRRSAADVAKCTRRRGILMTGIGKEATAIENVTTQCASSKELRR